MWQRLHHLPKLSGTDEPKQSGLPRPVSQIFVSMFHSDQIVKLNIKPATTACSCCLYSKSNHRLVRAQSAQRCHPESGPGNLGEGCVPPDDALENLLQNGSSWNARASLIPSTTRFSHITKPHGLCINTTIQPCSFGHLETKPRVSAHCRNCKAHVS